MELHNIEIEVDKITAVGNKMYSRCGWCNKIVQLNKPVVGGLHVCLTDEEKRAKLQRRV